MILSEQQKSILDYVKKNQPCRTLEIINNTRVKQSALYEFLKSDYFIKSQKINGGSGSHKGGGFYYLYSINEDKKDRIVFCTMKPIRISHHPIMRAFYGL